MAAELTTDATAPEAQAATRTLPRVLGPVAAFCVVVGSVIGSGIFMVPATVAREMPGLVPIVALWIIGGVFSTAGALTLAELGAMLPQAGGPYVYLREAYGRLPAFLFGWSEFLINRTGSMATLAAAFATYFAEIAPAPGGLDPRIWHAGAAIAAIVTVTIVNVLSTAMGSRLQVAGTALKVGGVIALIVIPWLIGGGSSANLAPSWPAPRGDASLLSGALVAMVGILWAYDGWMNLTPMAEEVHDPGRNIPIALITGMAALVALYLGMTLMYHYVLPMDQVASAQGSGSVSKGVAATYCRALMGEKGVVAISLLVMCSTFISLNGNALTGPRAYFAMARDGLFPQWICRIHPQFSTPAAAVLSQGAWAVGLTVVGTLLILWPAPGPDSALPGFLRTAWTKLNATPLYDLLYTYVIFGANVFYTLAIASVFVLRKTRPDAPRPYRTWGYPVTPLIFVLAAVYLLGAMLIEKPVESLMGLLIIATGIPAYLVFSRKSRTTEARAS